MPRSFCLRRVAPHFRRLDRVFGLAVLVSLAACTPVTPPSTAPAHITSMPPRPWAAPEKLAAMDGVVADAIAAKKTPGGVLWFEHDGHTYHKVYGQRALVPAPEAATADTIYDAASLTKVIAT